MEREHTHADENNQISHVTETRFCSGTIKPPSKENPPFKKKEHTHPRREKVTATQPSPMTIKCIPGTRYELPAAGPSKH